MSRTCSLCVVAVSGDDPERFAKLQLLRKLIGNGPLVVLAHEMGVSDAVRLIRNGVADVIEIPAPVEQVVERAFAHLAGSGGEARDAADGLIGDSVPMQELRRRIGQAARVASTVLIEGETGTGKGLVAREIHRRSDRSGEPFVHVDCGALASSLIESELFGHERGAFTGAAGLRRGRFEIAGRGTIFLDEISELEPRLQVKLLRLLEDRMFERVGGSETLHMRARVIAAANVSLSERVRAKAFRHDLYFRLNVIRLEVCPLRQRSADLRKLAEAGLRRAAGMLEVQLPRVNDDFYLYLSDHDWPGNVRELMNLMERALAERLATLTGADCERLLDSAEPTHGLVRGPSEPALAQGDQGALISAALHDTGGNVSRAARRLGIARGTLRYQIRKLGLRELIPKD